MVGVAQPSLTSAGLILWPTYVHLLAVGWLTQLIFGVAYWMFPRHRAASSPWSERLGWLAYSCLNAGLVLRAIAESGPLTALRSGWFLLSALLQLIAGWSFVIATWPRVRGR
jgi:heme/copper-type cytochrome/quinol oxidase subunit 1